MKLKHIDALRGIAVLLVILVHTSQSIPGISLPLRYFSKYGQMGVQLFFIISAYTLCLSMERHQGEYFKLLNYAIRRFFRIAPLYYTAIFFYMLWSSTKMYIYLGNLTIDSKYNFMNLFTNFLFLHGFYSPANNNIVPGGWSIGTEMSFYVIFPFIFTVFNKITRRKTVLYLMLPLIMLLINIIFQFVFQITTGFSADNHAFIYNNLINQLPVFFLGITLFFIDKNQLIKYLNWQLDIIIFIFFTAISMMLMFQPHFPYRGAIMPFISGLSFVFLYNFSSKKNFLNHQALMNLGRVSFSVYIFHFLFAWDLSRMIYDYLKSYLPRDILLIMCFIITTILTYKIAVITENLIEKRGINLGKLLIEKIKNKSV
ncbi:acyltransferase family protein [Anabaena catenula]|uniref:Acyltransferase n=1 Tax=Anabaena catenula FACHB-362 TaxID=2692877 RepID=A0ABR8IVZ1_9NOST|nr:acyltransferase [Anabaena catenula]MBD2690227.1 acyltransferase [Anabaena catenula FACHB-362]